MLRVMLTDSVQRSLMTFPRVRTRRLQAQPQRETLKPLASYRRGNMGPSRTAIVQEIRLVRNAECPSVHSARDAS